MWLVVGVGSVALRAMGVMEQPTVTWQLVVTPGDIAAREIEAIAASHGIKLEPIPVYGPDEELTLDPEHWPGDDRPTYKIVPAGS